MRNKFVMAILSAVVSLAFAGTMAAQGHGGGHGGGQGRPGGAPIGGPGGRPDMEHRGSPTDRPGSHMERSSEKHMTQQPLKDSQINGGAFRMLEKKTGLTSEQLQDLYKSSGARNFGQFTSGIVVAKNLNLDQAKVLEGLKTMSLGETLKSLGVPKDKAKQAISEANKQVKEAEKNRG